MSGISLETLETKIDLVADNMTKFLAANQAMMDKDHPKEEKDAAIKKAEDEKKEEEKKEAKRAVRDAAILKANDEKDPEKKDAAIRKANDDYNDEPSKKKEAMSTNDMEKEANIAAILGDKKIEIDNKILHVAQFTNPTGITALKEVLASNTFIASKAMLDNLALTYGAAIFESNSNNLTNKQQQSTPTPFFMAGAMNNPTAVDTELLTASSSIRDFAKLSTKELLEGKSS